MVLTSLNNVTLFSLVGSDEFLEPTLKAINHCKRISNFKETKVASCIEFNEEGIEYIPITKLTKEEYCHFFLYELNNYIDSDFCLTIQSDGFIIDGNHWDDNFLDYDYIGAPWLNFKEQNCVGNGGFSLRSKKFLECCKNLQYKRDIQFQPHIKAGDLITPEDWFCCVYHYNTMRKNGIKFADIDTAYNFSVEHPSFFKQYNRNDITTYKSFGFHGTFNKAGMNLL